MIKKRFILFKIARKLATSDALEIFYKIHRPPFFIKLFFNLLSLSISSKKNDYITKLSSGALWCATIKTRHISRG